jgi:hypothetical protein
MSTSTSTTLATNSSAANFRSWGKAIDDQFTALGWVRTSDTGQINWTTVAVPSGAGVFMGYSIFRMADTLQSTTPIFLKVEYGSSSAATATPAIRITVGQSTNGTGSITGNAIAPVAINAPGTYATADAVSYYSGSTGWFVMATWVSASVATNTGIFFSIERTKDTTGADNAEGVLIAWGYSGGQYQNQVLLAAGAATLETTASAPLPISSANFTFGTNVGLAGMNYFAGKRMNDGLASQSYVSADFLVNITITVTTYGSAHTYRTLGDRMGYLNTNSNHRVAMRYE